MKLLHCMFTDKSYTSMHAACYSITNQVLAAAAAVSKWCWTRHPSYTAVLWILVCLRQGVQEAVAIWIFEIVSMLHGMPRHCAEHSRSDLSCVSDVHETQGNALFAF